MGAPRGDYAPGARRRRLLVAPIVVACSRVSIVSAFVRRAASASVMSAVASCVAAAAISGARDAVPLSGAGRNG
jgi:hypothetical protein